MASKRATRTSLCNRCFTSFGSAHSRKSSTASRRFASAFSTVRPWLATSSSGHSATYISSSRSRMAVKFRLEIMFVLRHSIFAVVVILVERTSASKRIILRVDCIRHGHGRGTEEQHGQPGGERRREIFMLTQITGEVAGSVEEGGHHQTHAGVQKD